MSTGSQTAEHASKQYFRLSAAWVLIACLIGTSGCAHLNSIYRNKPIGNDIQSVSIDAKQRMVFTARDLNESNEFTNFRVLCAEPSPDVFSAFAASLSGSVESDSIKAALQGAFSENAATIGLRTQVIQLLRDGMYRICEGVISNQISEGEFYSLHQRYQRIMVTLVAIEQLTGAVRPPPIAIHTDALAGRPARLPELQSDLDQAKQQLESAQTKFENTDDPEYDEDEELNCSDFEGEEKDNPEVCGDYFAAKSARDEKQATVDSLEEAIKVARSEIVNQASGQVVISTAFQRGPTISSDTAGTISKTVQTLVGNLWDIDFDTALDKYGEFRCDRFLDEEGQLVSSSKIATQARSVMPNVRALLQAEGDISGANANDQPAFQADLRQQLGVGLWNSCFEEIEIDPTDPGIMANIQAQLKSCQRSAAMCNVLSRAVSSTIPND